MGNCCFLRVCGGRDAGPLARVLVPVLILAEDPPAEDPALRMPAR